jgi:hypothetical protein
MSISYLPLLLLNDRDLKQARQTSRTMTDRKFGSLKPATNPNEGRLKSIRTMLARRVGGTHLLMNKH